MKKQFIASTLGIALFISCAYTQTLAPDGSYVGGEHAELAPDSSYVGGSPELTPEGSYTGE